MPLAWEVGLHEADNQRAATLWCSNKIKLINLHIHLRGSIHSLSAYRPTPAICRAQDRSTNGGLKLMSYSPFLPIDGFILHIKGHVSIHEDTQSPSPRSAPVPACPIATLWSSQGPRGVRRVMATFGRTDPRQKPKQDLLLATGHLMRMVYVWQVDFREDLSPWL